MRLAPGEVAAMELGYETLAGDPVAGAECDERFEEIVERENHVAITSWTDPDGDECPTLQEMFGGSLVLRTGRRTWIDRPALEGELVTARVWTSHTVSRHP